MRLIETTDLERWADSTSARSRFPQLVKDLICAVIEPDKLRFPSGDAVWMPGFDGELVSSEKNRFVPTGSSAWELGTAPDYKGKANEDFKKRSKNRVQRGKKGKTARKLDRKDTTFVFVTPRIWQNKDDRLAEWKKKDIWRDVMIIDGVDLQEWLEVAHAVTLQFVAELGLAPEAGLQTPDQAWEEWRHRTSPPASEELVLIGREEQEKEVISRLLAGPNTFTVRGDSPREAWGFALAALRRVESAPERQSLYARTIVAENEEVAARLQYRKNLIILLKQARGQVPGHLSAHGAHVIVPEGNDIHSERNFITLTRPTRRMFAEALARMGLPEEDAERAARACGLSVTILQRRLAPANSERPSWADGQTVHNLLPALLAGRWSDRSKADRKILCRLAGVSKYTDVESQLHGFLSVDESPLQKIDEMWTLTAPVDAFQLIARRLTPSYLDRFKRAFRAVFRTIDPKVELPPDEWLYHDLKGKQGHSGWLRSGMAETLLLIAERGTDAHLMCLASPRTFVEDVVRGLPGLNEDWRILGSLRDQYARLMEAAPGPFLDSLECLLEARPDDLRRLFIEGGVLGSVSLHTGLLWGLETLAWSPDYLPRVALVLARLARLDPGGRLANRPINSLREIFLWWHPGTYANFEQRLAALDLILEREGQVGWDLLAALLPRATSSIASPTPKPQWRDFGELPEDAYDRRSQLKYVSALVDRALERAGSDPKRWTAVLDSLRVMNGVQREKALALLHDIARAGEPADVKTMLWEVLRDFIAKHRSFNDAQWALPAGVLNQMEAILPRLAPDDSVERNKWLFDEWLPDLPSHREGLERHRQKVDEWRRQAVQEILEKQGAQGLVRLGTVCKFPGFIAHSAVPLMKELGEVRGLIEQAIMAGESGIFFAGQISGRAQELHGEAWCKLVRKDAKAGVWSPALIAALMLWWPDARATWKEIEALGEEVKAEYWRRKPVRMIEGSPEDQIYQINQLIGVGRAPAVFDCTASQGETLPSATLLRIFDATIKELAKAQTTDEVRRLGLDSYDVRQFLDLLRNRADISREEVARREYQALPLLGSLDVQGLTIHEFMAEDSTFFVDVLCEVYLPAHRDKSERTEPTVEAQARAQAAYTLLKNMERIPGQREGDEIDEAVLFEWIHAVRNKALDRDRSVIADQQIGHILAHAPADAEDSSWPHRVVRNVVERIAANHIDRGLTVERYNMRGIYKKALYEGGDQERALASQYRGWADLLRPRWPRMARVLETIAEGWEEYARREDAEAEQDRIDLS